MPSITAEDAAQILRVFLAEATTLGLCTIDDAHTPHAANVNFAADADLNLLFVSHPQSAHSHHIAVRPQVACTIYTPFRDPAQIRGVQMRGVCHAVPEDEFDAAYAMFCRRFEYAERFEQRIRSERFYRVQPSWIRFIDNSVAFGYKWQTDWPTTGEVPTP